MQSKSFMNDTRKNSFVQVSIEDYEETSEEGERNEFAPLPSLKVKTKQLNTIQHDQSLKETCQGEQYQY